MQELPAQRNWFGFGWVTSEPIDITVINARTVLFKRVRDAGAFVQEATEEGDLLINGKVTTDYDERWLYLADLVLLMVGTHVDARVGRTYRIHDPAGEALPVAH
jgi:hypothetical protein